jgi:hypothetical protein
LFFSCPQPRTSRKSCKSSLLISNTW